MLLLFFMYGVYIGFNNIFYYIYIVRIVLNKMLEFDILFEAVLIVLI